MYNATPLDPDGSARTPSLEITGVMATIRLNRPRQHNRIDLTDVAVLEDHFAAVEAEPAVRALILTASGESFSSGYDLNAAGASQRGETISTDREMAFSRLCDRLEAIRMPTICALNGNVYGGATDLALACDFRIGVTGMRLRMPAGSLGIQFYPSGLRRYVSRLGLGAARRLFLTAETIDGDEMLRIGFLDEIVVPDRLEAASHGLAGRIASCAPRAIAGMKRALSELARGTMDERAGEAAFLASLQSDECRDALHAWSRRRQA